MNRLAEYEDCFPELPHCKINWTGQAGALEGETTWPRQGEVKGVAVICHPHPLQGGTMHNKVVTTLMRFYRDRNWATVRFNFRGVGGSAGEYGAMVGEQEDLWTVWQWVRRVVPHLPIALAGFSFGSYIAAAVANEVSASLKERAHLHHLISVAPPVDRCGFEILQSAVPWYVVMGEQDEIVSFDSVMQWVSANEQNIHLLSMPNAGHFFHGQLTAMISLLDATVCLD